MVSLCSGNGKIIKSQVQWAPGRPGSGQEGVVCRMFSLTLCPVFQVATDRPLREEELPHHPHHSPLTLCPPLLEGSLLHRASHRATEPPHNSVSPGARGGLSSTPLTDYLALARGVQSKACPGSSVWKQRMGWPCGLQIYWLWLLCAGHMSCHSTETLFFLMSCLE